MATAQPTIRRSFTYDERARQYRDVRGNYVSDQVVRFEFEKVTREGVRRAEGIAKKLQSGAINLPAFQIEMRDLIKSLHTAAGATAAGGWKQMSPAMWGKVGSETRIQYEYLNRLGLQIEQGLNVNSGAFLNRVKLYAKAARSTFENFSTYLQKRAGREEAKRILNAAEICVGCVKEAAKGWVSIDAMLPIGAAICKVNCKCSVDYR
jgi:hypothetical protein